MLTRHTLAHPLLGLLLALVACGDAATEPPVCGEASHVQLEAAALATALPPDNSCAVDADCTAVDVQLICPSDARIGYCPAAVPVRFLSELPMRRAEAETVHCDTFAPGCVSFATCAPASPVCGDGVCRMRLDER